MKPSPAVFLQGHVSNMRKTQKQNAEKAAFAALRMIRGESAKKIPAKTSARIRQILCRKCFRQRICRYSFPTPAGQGFKKRTVPLQVLVTALQIYTPAARFPHSIVAGEPYPLPAAIRQPSVL